MKAQRIQYAKKTWTHIDRFGRQSVGVPFGKTFLHLLGEAFWQILMDARTEYV